MGCGRSEPQNRVCNFLRLHQPPLWIVFGEFLQCLFRRPPGLGDDRFDRPRDQWRIGKAGADGIDGHAGPCQFQRECPRQADDPVLGRDIGRDIGIARQAGGRSDIDDPRAGSLRFQVRQDCLRHLKDAGEVHRDHPVPQVERRLLKRSARAFAGVVDENVHRAEDASGRVEAGIDRVAIRHVEARHGGDILCAKFPGERLKRLGATPGQRDPRAASTNALAIAAPMPEPAPVTSACRPESLAEEATFMLFSYFATIVGPTGAGAAVARARPVSY